MEEIRTKKVKIHSTTKQIMKAQDSTQKHEVDRKLVNLSNKDINRLTKQSLGDINSLSFQIVNISKQMESIKIHLIDHAGDKVARQNHNKLNNKRLKLLAQLKLSDQQEYEKLVKILGIKRLSGTLEFTTALSTGKRLSPYNRPRKKRIPAEKMIGHQTSGASGTRS